MNRMMHLVLADAQRRPTLVPRGVDPKDEGDIVGIATLIQSVRRLQEECEALRRRVTDLECQTPSAA